MEVTLEQLKTVNPKELKVPYYRKMLESTIKYVERQGGKAWVHPHVLADFGIK
jgi:hypothetical protein